MAERLIFHYHARNTLIHKVDPRLKILLTFIITALMFAVNIMQFFVISGYVIAGCIIARLPFKRYRRELRFFIILLLVIFFTRWATTGNITDAAFYGARFIIIVAAGLLLTDSTSPEDMTLAVYWFLKPFPFFQPKRTAAKFNLTISFLPLIFDSVMEIQEARKSRMDNTWRKPVRRIISFATQVFDLILVKAEEITYALESRLFSEDILHGSISFSKIDALTGLLTAALIWGLWVLRLR